MIRQPIPTSPQVANQSAGGTDRIESFSLNSMHIPIHLVKPASINYGIRLATRFQDVLLVSNETTCVLSYMSALDVGQASQVFTFYYHVDAVFDWGTSRTHQGSSARGIRVNHYRQSSGSRTSKPKSPIRCLRWLKSELGPLRASTILLIQARCRA
jgi:hypothetical protein